MDKVLLSTLENFHCGERFKELCIRKKMESATEWAKILKLPHRNQVHYRWKSKNIAANELYIICDELNVTVDEFFGVDKPANGLVKDSSIPYKKGPYIEDRIGALEAQMKELLRKMAQ